MTRQPDPPRGGLGGSAAVMAAGTATSRVLGVVRIGVLVAAVGVNAVPANAFAVANTLPTIVYMLVAGGVLNAVLVPQVVRAYRSAGGQEYVDRLLTVAGALLLAITVLLTAAAPLIVRVLTGGGDTGLTALATTFAFWCMPQIFFYGLYTLLGQVLNAQGRFGPYMWAPVVNNLVSLAGLVLFIRLFGEFRAGGPASDAAWWDAGRVALLAGTATLGIVAQAAVLAVPLYRSGFRYRPRWRWRDSGLGGAGRVAGWTFAALAAGQVGVLTVVGVANAASTAGRSDVAGYAAYNAAFAMFMLPHSLVTVSLLTALFTRLSVHAAGRDEMAVRADASLGLRTIGVFTVLATAVLAVLALPLVRVVVWSSTPAEAASLAPIVVAMLAGLTALGAWSLCQRVFYAYEDARGLFWVQVAMAGVVVAGSVLAAAVLPRQWWVAGAGASIAASYVVGAVWAGGQLRRRLGASGARVVRVHVRAGVAAGVAAAVGWPLSRLPGDLSALAPLPAAALCVGVGVVMLAVYVLLLRLLDVTELDDLVRPLGARLRRSMGRPVPHDARRPDRTRDDDMLAHGGGLLDGVVTPVGPSTLLTGRYRLVETLPSDQPGVESWLAHDQILDRPVRALVLREGRVAQAQDAARRAALVQDPRLLRVLDVGEHDGVAYTVTEPLPGRDLAELTADGPLPADQARAIIGEAALALEAARRRGVHHLALRPSTVRVTPQGSVVVSGLAMDGELAGQDAGDDASAARADTVGLVGLLYLLLTGRWPAPPAEPGGHEPGAGVLPPAELSPHVPNDLDTLCAVTLGPHDDGPHTPAELVRELEPWRPIAAEELFGALDARAGWKGRASGARRDGRPAQGADGTGTGVEDTAPGALDPVAAREVQRQSVRSTFAGQRTVPPRPGTPPPAIPPAVRRADPRVAAAQSARGVGPVVQAAVDPAPTAAMPVTPAPEEEDARRPHDAAAPRNAGRPTPAAAVGAPRDPTARPVAAHATFDTLIGRSGDALTQRQFDPTPLVLGLVALGVVVGLVTAWNALTAPAPPLPGADTLGALEEPVAEEPVAEEPVDPAAPGEPAAPVEPPAPAAPAAPPVIVEAQQIDPPPGGDGNEHPEAVPLAVDGDPATFWYSRTYRSPTYGMKPGIGYGITLAEPAVVSTVTLTVNGEGGMVEVRATDAANPTAGELLASGPLGPETVLTLSAPTETQNLVLWFPALPQTADGSNRIELAEVALS